MAQKRRAKEIEEEREEGEIDFVLFQGPLNGNEVNLKENAKLARAGLVPAKQLVTDALSRRAEVLLVEPKGGGAIVKMLVDGVPFPGGRLSRQQALAVTQMLKLLAGLNVQQRKKPQAGGIKAELEKTPYELSVESTPVAEGAERLTVRAANLNERIETPDEAGFPAAMKSRIRELMSQKRGVGLVCGPPHSGVTTTTFGTLRSVDAYMYSILTIADMGGRDVINVTPFEVNPIDSFEETIVRLVRVEADVLFVDPIGNAETAKRIFEQCEHMAFLTEFAARDTAHGILQLCEWVGDPEIVASKLHFICSQRLIRRLCKDCREAYRPHPKLLARVGLPPETKVLYRHSTRPSNPEPDEEEAWQPCESCGGIGYKGRTGVFEMIEMTESLQELIKSRPDVAAIKALARKDKMQTLQREGIRLVAEGTTSLEELQRIFKSG